ncbi:MAG: methyltransferase [Litorilituus sp.]|nr:methyltransferase [Litorilituus sp.]
MQQSLLIEKYLLDLQRVSQELQAPVLDLACGRGRNGLYLLQHDIPVTFADINNEALEHVKLNIGSVNANKQDIAQYWQTDFEQEPILTCNNSHPLHGKLFSAIIVFRYLHRPLFDHIKASVKPRGMIIYQTFTEQQAQLGRPKNPNFLLKSGELLEIFTDWEIVHSFEGVVSCANNESKQAIAQIVAIKP